MSRPRSQYRAGDLAVPGYRLVRRLGNGFSGTVWIARGAGGTEVALKIVELQKIGGRKELQALRTIRNVRHPNLCEVHGFWVKDTAGRLLEDGESEAIIPKEGSLELGVLEDDDTESVIRQSTAPFDSSGLAGTSSGQNPPAAPHPPSIEDMFESGVFDTNVVDLGGDDAASGPATPPKPEHAEIDVLATQDSGGLGDSGPIRISGRTSDSGSASQTDASATHESGAENSSSGDSGRRSSGRDRASGSGGTGSGTSGTGTSGSGSSGSGGTGSSGVGASGSSSATGSGGSNSKGRRRAAAEQLIIVMSLGEMTLHDRLAEVRQENGLDSKDNQTTCGLDAEEAIRYVRASASAIDLLMQKHSIMHGDIKPQNILLVGGEAQVCDFGLANKMVEDILKTKHPFVSPAYGAPEVLNGTGYTKTADQYALAVTYFELRTGQFPFDHRTKGAILKAKTLDQFDFDQLLPTERLVIRKAMDSNPEDRFGCCTEFAQALSVAAGLEKSGGLKPMRVALGGLVLATLLLGIAYWLRPDTSKVATDLLGKGNEILQSYDPEKNYIASRDPLRQSIDKLNEGLGNCEDIVQQTEFRDRIGLACHGLCDELFDELATVTSDPNAPVRNETLIENDISLLTESGDESVQKRLAMIRLQHSLVTHDANDSATPISDETLQSIRTQVEAFDAATQPQRSLREFIVSAVGLAVAHGNARPTDSDPSFGSRYFTETPRLDDLVRAEQWLAKHGIESIPSWLAEQWNELRSGGLGFLTDLRTALTDDAINEMAKDKIREHWPLLATEALLAELRAHAENGRWDDFIEQQPNSTNVATGPTSIQSKLRTFADVANTLADGNVSASILNRVQSQLKEADEPTRGFLANSTIAWLREIAMRAGDGSWAGSFTRQEVEALHEASTAIADSLDQTIPIEFDQWLLARTIESGAIVSTTQSVKTARQRLSLAGHPLAVLFDSEHSAISGKRLSSVQLARLENALLKPEDLTSLHDNFRSVYLPFQAGLVSWHAGNSADAIPRFAKLLTQDLASQAENDSRAVKPLGKQRSEWILRANVDELFGRIDADTDEFLLPDTKLDADLDRPLAFAKRWHACTPNCPEELTQSLTLIEFAGKTPKPWPLPQWQLAELDSLSQASRPLSPKDRLLVRIAFEASRASDRVSKDLASSASSSRVPVLIKSAATMLDRGLDRRVATPTWIREVLAPSLSTLLAAGTRDWKSPTGWKLAQAIDLRPVQRLAQHGERAKDVPLLETELARLAKANARDEASEFASDPVSGELLRTDVIELCCAQLAAAKDMSPEGRFRLLVAAAELFQQRMELRGLPWDEPSLRQFASYITAAERSVPGTSEAAILRAFAIYQRALMRLAGGAEISGELEAAAESVGAAIDRVVDQRATTAHYNACWRHANLLIGLAFRQPTSQRKDTLLLARMRAMQAVNMLRELPRTTVANPAFLAMGNACEDLAFYCQWESPEKRSGYYEQAIEHFVEAVQETRDGISLRPRYSLARCRFRYFETGNGGREQLRQAEQTLGELDTKASLTSQVEWLAWSAKIQAAMGNSDQSLGDVRKAYQLLSEESNDAIEKQQRDEVTRFLADRLADSDRAEDWEEAMALLSTVDATPSSKTFWDAHVLRCELLHRSNRYNDFANELRSPSVDVVVNQVERSPRDVMAQLAGLSFQLAATTFAQGLGDPPKLEPETATSCIDYLTDVLKAGESVLQADEVSSIYAAIVNANLNADPTTSLRENATAYINALEGQSPKVIQTSIAIDARRFLLRLFTYYFFAAASQRDEARTQLVTQLQSLPTDLRERVLKEMNDLLASGVVLAPGEKQAIQSLLPKYFEQIPPAENP